MYFSSKYSQLCKWFNKITWCDVQFDWRCLSYDPKQNKLQMTVSKVSSATYSGAQNGCNRMKIRFLKMNWIIRMNKSTMINRIKWVWILLMSFKIYVFSIIECDIDIQKRHLQSISSTGATTRPIIIGLDVTTLLCKLRPNFESSQQPHRHQKHCEQQFFSRLPHVKAVQEFPILFFV